MERIRDNFCCTRHLAKCGHGTIDVYGQLIINPQSTHRNGESIRCGTCGRMWEHQCQSGEWCRWVTIVPGQVAPDLIFGASVIIVRSKSGEMVPHWPRGTFGEDETPLERCVAEQQAILRSLEENVRVLAANHEALRREVQNLKTTRRIKKCTSS